MNETFLQYWGRIKQFWNKYTKSQKIILASTVGILVLVVVLVAINFSKTEYSNAFTELTPSDAASIQQYLDGAKIPYKLSEDGKTIGVPKNEVASVRIQVEAQGLNKTGSVGYGAFRGKSTFGMTDNEFKIKHLDAVQGEIQQSISSIQSISDSKVVITMPDDKVFVQQQQETATASVVVHVKPGYTLDQQKIDTIYNLVSKSVKNLPVDNITIANQDGDLLPYSKTMAGAVSPGNIAVEQFQIKAQFEQRISKQIKEMLGGMLGNEKVLPMVVATLNFDKKSSKEQLVRPLDNNNNNGIIVSEQHSGKSATGDSGATGGVPGTGQTDVPNYPSSSGSGKTNSEETANTINYEINRITNEIDSSPFAVTDLTINVGIEPPVKTDPSSLNQATVDRIQQMLTSVVSTSLANSGKTLTPADLATRVTVFPHTFAGITSSNTSGTNWYLIGGIGALAVAAAAAAGFLISRRRRAQEEELRQSAKMELSTIDIENVSNENQARKQLEQLAKRKPEEFTNLLRTWLVDE